MKHRIRITAGDVSMEAELGDSHVAQAIWTALPIEQSGAAWGDEIYFEIPVQAEAENPQEVVESGDLGYWPPGNAFCIFFGPTPASHGDEIRVASAVSVFGRLLDNPKICEEVKQGDNIVVERVCKDSGQLARAFVCPETIEEYIQRFEKSAQILGDLKRKGVSAGVYTQTTDVEGEVNGLMTYDRKFIKIPADTLYQMHRMLYKE